MIDLRELIYVHDALLDGKWKRTNEIAAEILEKNEHKIGFKVTQNYLQSILRPLVEYDSSNYKYRLKSLESSSSFDRIQLKEVQNYLTPILITSKGADINVEVNTKVNKDNLIKAVVAVNTENPKFNLLKKINFKLFDQYDE